MKIQISYASEKPMYEQIEDSIRRAVLSGELTQDYPLPSVRSLAGDLNISTITVKRAYADLEREGILYTISGKGTFIRLDNAGKLKDAHTEKLLALFEKTAGELRAAGIERQKLTDLLSRIWEETNDREESTWN